MDEGNGCVYVLSELELLVAWGKVINTLSAVSLTFLFIYSFIYF